MKAPHVWIAIVLAIAIGVVSSIDTDSTGALSRSAVLWLIVGVVLYSHRAAFSGNTALRVIGIAGLLLRIPLALAHLVVAYWVYGGDVDLLGFYAHGVRVGREFLEGRFEETFLGFDGSVELGVAVVTRLSALLYLIVGPSVVGMSLVSGLLGFFGSVFFLRAYQIEFPSSRQSRFLALCLFLFPGLAFWTSLLGKDSWMFFFLGWLTYSVVHLIKAPRIRHVCGLIISLTFIHLIRATTTPILVAAIGAAFLVTVQSRVRGNGPAAILRPVVYVLCISIIAGMVAFTVSAGPRQSELVESAGSPIDSVLALAVHKHVGLARDPSAGGSSLKAQITEPTISEAIQFLPVGIFTFLFRPLLFEAHNALAFAAALDGTLLGFVVIWKWCHLLAAARAGLSRPLLAFCWTTFVLLTMGLAFESNLGVIVRHRTMVLPFLFLFLAVPRPEKSSAKTAEGNSSSTPSLPLR